MSVLNAKERIFVSEFVKTRHGKNAAIAAGYSAKTAESKASQLLRKVKIREAVDRRLKELEERSLITTEYVLFNLKEVVERCMTHVPVMEFDHEAKEMVQKTGFVENEDRPGTFKQVGIYEFDSSGANRALELIGRHLEMFTDKVKHDASSEFFTQLEEAVKRGNKIAES